jgi:hypothetical protein
MKKEYQIPEFDFLLLNCTDVIVTSNGTGDDEEENW